MLSVRGMANSEEERKEEPSALGRINEFTSVKPLPLSAFAPIATTLRAVRARTARESRERASAQPAAVTRKPVIRDGIIPI